LGGDRLDRFAASMQLAPLGNRDRAEVTTGA
jgi:hypothetical protein